MKKNIFLILALAISITSCKKFLEEATSGLPIMFPLEQISDDGAYSTSTNFVAERSQLDIMTFTSANSVIGGMWSRSYTVINRANNVIKFAVDSTKIRPKAIRLAQAQARFFRAFYHFRLVQIFGDIPLMTQPADVTVGNVYPMRIATRIVYDSVIKDLVYAKANLDSSYGYSSSDGGRVTAAAAKALLGKVYLTMAGYPLNDPAGHQLAIDELKDLIDNKARYNIDLNPIFANVFTPTLGTKQVDKERIYFIRGTTALANSLQAFTRMGWTFRTFRYSTPSKDYATDAVLARRVYETGDSRRNVTVSNFALANFSSSLVSKYNSTNNDDASDDLILLRYADVLMMTAESLTEIGGTANLNAALAIVNNVRRTHGGTILPALTYTDQADLRTKLRQERRREFAFECMRWFDLKRWNVLIPAIKASLADYYNKPLSDYDFLDNPAPDRYKVLPIPIQEIANNPNVTQNPGF
jgi:starch-binding outer membrane protein, SusD/RagB family